MGNYKLLHAVVPQELATDSRKEGVLRRVVIPIALLLAAFAATGASFGAGKDCGPIQQQGTLEDGALYIQGADGKYSKVARNASFQRAGSQVPFLYVISRDHPEYLHGGAVMVRTERFSTSQIPFTKVLLYRNPIPGPLRSSFHNSSEYDDDVPLADYTSFQNFGDISRTSREKIKIFHAPYSLFGEDFNTDEPSEKLFQFSFEPFVSEEKQRIPRASIYFYENINPGGTCIPFHRAIVNARKTSDQHFRIRDPTRE